MSDGDDPFTHSQRVVCVHTTQEAIKVTPVHPHKPIPFWVPQDCVHDDSDVYDKGHEGRLVVKKYWADKQGWV